MAIKPVLAYPNKALRDKCLEVSQFDDQLKTFVADLFETMDVATGAGLAAPQIGAKARVIVISKHVAKTDAHQAYVNPVVVARSSIMQSHLEGCLSFHGEFLTVKRPFGVTVEYQDLAGEKHTLETTGYFAQALLHEIEHLDGKLLIDHAPIVKREMINRRSKHLAGKMYDYRSAGVESGT